MSDKYNGWNNYETWNANLWLDQDFWFDQAKNALGPGSLAEQMESEHREYMEETTQPAGMFTDLLQSAFDAIDWYEIAEHIFEDANEEI